MEPTLEVYVAALVNAFREIWRVLRDDGTVWVNLGDCYATCIDKVGKLKPKNLVGLPWRVALALQTDGWYLRSDIIWAKLTCMPEPVTDRPTKSHEYIFLMAKSERYYYDGDAIAETTTETSGWSRQRMRGLNTWEYNNTAARIAATGQRVESSTFGTFGKRNKRSVWTINTEFNRGAHFAVFPEALVEPCILAGAPVGGLVFDPFIGSGTVGAVAERLSRRWVGIDLSYQDLAIERTAQRGFMFDTAV